MQYAIFHGRGWTPRHVQLAQSLKFLVSNVKERHESFLILKFQCKSVQMRSRVATMYVGRANLARVVHGKITISISCFFLLKETFATVADYPTRHNSNYSISSCGHGGQIDFC